MTDVPPARRKITTFKVLSISSIFVLVCCAIPAPVFVLGWILIVAELVAVLLFGWVGFLRRVAFEMEFAPLGILVGIGSLTLLIVGVQYAVKRAFPNRSWTSGQTIKAVMAVVGIFLAGICMVGLGHELAWSQRSETPWIRIGSSWDGHWVRIKSKENLKEIGLGVHNYADENQTFPMGGKFHIDGTAEHGWMTALLPYVHQLRLYDKVRFDVPWYHQVNREVFETRVPTYDYRTIRDGPNPAGKYANAYIAANDRLMSANFGIDRRTISDGTSNTIFAGEVSQNFRPWGDVANWRNVELGINHDPKGFGGPQAGGAMFLLADGSVRFISQNTDPKTLRALATPNENDFVGEY